MTNKDFFLAIEMLEKEKGIPQAKVIESLETALTIACKKHFGEASNVIIKLNPEKSTIRVYISKVVVAEVEFPEREISLEDARQVKKSYKIGDEYLMEIDPRAFGRIAAQNARQVIINNLHQAEKDVTYNQFADKENELLVGVVTRIKDDGTIFVEIGKNQMEGTLSVQEQIPGEHFQPGDRIKVLVKRVRDGAGGTQVILSRASYVFIRRLFENEVPEIKQEIVQIKNIVREAGFRTKMAVYSNDPEIDAVGACVGNKGARVNAIVEEIGGEKIDIIPWSSEPLEFIANALSPASVIYVFVQGEESAKQATVIVADEKLSLAIGKDGQNARLAAKLTGWKVDVKPYSVAQRNGLFDNIQSAEETDGE